MQRRIVLVILGGLNAAGAAWSQEAPRPQADGLGDIAVGRGGETYVDDSFEVNELLRQLADFERDERWVEASLLVDRLQSTEGDRPVPVDESRYERLGAGLNRRVSGWPGRGLSVYRELFETGAAAARVDAKTRRDSNGAMEVLNRYWCTSASVLAAEDLYEISLERGEFERARWLCREMIAKHPEKEVTARMFHPRLAIAAAMAGREAEAHEVLSETGIDTGDSTVRWMGRPEQTAALVTQLLSEAAAGQETAESGAWPTFGGNYSRDRIGRCPLDELAMLWRVDLTGSAMPKWQPTEDPGVSAPTDDLARQLCMHPVADDELVYVQSHDGVWGLNKRSGAPAWHVPLGVSGAGLPPSEGGVAAWLSPTLDGDRLYVSVGSEPSPYLVSDGSEPAGGVYCLDARRGQILWRSREAPQGEAYGRFSYDSSPIVVGGHVYAVGRRRRTFGFEDCYLYQLRASDGAVVRRTHLGSGSTGGFGYERPALSILSRVDDSIYVGTHLGSVAAVCAHTGQLEWLFTYERESESNWRNAVRATGREALPWHYNPAFCDGERLVYLPGDTQSLFILNRQDGSLLKSVDAEVVANATTLLGIANGRLFGLGDLVFAFDLRSLQMAWTSVLKQEERVYGRGMLVENGVLVPTHEALVRFDSSDGARSDIAWDSAGGAGNLLPLSEQLVVAGPDFVSAYGRKSDVWKRLRQLMAALPDDPAPALDLAEAAFRSGDFAEAAAVLATAVERAGDAAIVADPGVRKRLYQDSLWFARGISGKPAPDAARVGQYYGWAARFAPDAQSHVECRLQHALFLEHRSDASGAVKLYQEIIQDRSLREQPVTTADVDNLAGRVAEDRIAALIAEAGRVVYAPFDQEARDWLEAARASGELELAERIITTRPLAEAVPSALRLQAEILRRRGSPGEAARAYTQSMLTDPRQFRSADTMRLIADCHLDGGDRENAWRRLTQAGTEFPKATVMLDGEAVSVWKYRDARLGAGYAGDVRRTRVRPPLAMRYDVFFSDPMTVLKPILPPRPGGDDSHVLAYTEGRLMAIDVVSGATAWEVSTFKTRPELLLTTLDSVVLSSPHEVIALSGADGSVRWTYGERPAGLDDPSTDPERFPSFHSHAWHGDRLFTMRSDGRASCVRFDDGRVEWERFLEHRIAGPFAVNGRRLVYPGQSASSNPYCVLDAETGRLLRTIERAQTFPVFRSHLTWDDRLIVLGSKTIDAYDVTTGQWLWHLRQEEMIVDATVVIGLDGVYLNDEDSRMKRVRLHDGRVEWRTSPLFRFGPQSVRAEPVCGALLLVTEQGVNAIHENDGRVLWESGPFVEGALDEVLVSSTDVVVVSSSETEGRREYAAYFVGYDPETRDGGAAVARVALTDLGDVRGAVLGPDTLVVYTPRRITGWRSIRADAGDASAPVRP
ncbi:MAG: PQQ-binding-like beta-propeller repeat protein [Phycisphaerales bacterium]|nr:PQQ-binding-like beta-propeller repeat protein [Phycisphaerales bacterium]